MKAGFPGIMSAAIGRAFSPTSIIGLQLWLDASDTSTITEAAALVSQWDDKSGQGNHATQGVGTSQPTTGTDTQNGLNTLTFITDDFLEADTIGAVMEGEDKPYTIFCVSTTSTSGDGYPWSWGDTIETDFHYMRYDDPGFRVAKFDGTSTVAPANAGSQVNDIYDIFTFRNTGTTFFMSRQGVIIYNFIAMDVDAMQTDMFTLGALRRSAGTGTFLNGNIAEFIIYDRVLNSSEAARIEQYLAVKWGLSIKTPNNIPNLQLWLDASDTSSITESSGAVSQWDDKSGQGNDATQGTGSAQPATGVNTQNGKNVITATTDDTLLLPSALHSITNGPNTTFIVSKLAAETASIHRVINGTEAGSSRYIVQYDPTAGNISFASGTTGTSTTTTGNTNTTFNIIRGRRSGTTQALSINGAAETTTANGADEPGVDALYLFSQAGSFNFFTGDCAEVLVYNRSLSTEEISAVEKYLSNKWGVTI